jgi:large subunit ribosomal protein L14
VLGGSGKKVARAGDKVVVVIKSVKSGIKKKGSIQKGEISHAVVVRTKPSMNENAVVLVNNKNETVGTRILGPISARLIRKG